MKREREKNEKWKREGELTMNSSTGRFRFAGWETRIGRSLHFIRSLIITSSRAPAVSNHNARNTPREMAIIRHLRILCRDRVNHWQRAHRWLSDRFLVALRNRPWGKLDPPSQVRKERKNRKKMNRALIIEDYRRTKPSKPRQNISRSRDDLERVPYFVKTPRCYGRQ